MIVGGRAAVRCTLYMATLVGIRFNPVIKSFYERLLAQGKLKKVEGLSLEFTSRACKPRALTACMHKFLIILNGMVKSGEPWQPQIADSSSS